MTGESKIVRLNGLATFIGIVGLTVALVVLVALLVRLGGFQLVKPWVQQQQFAVIKLEL
ncbi:BnaC01g38490D [Brassica napus]|uniref:BnaC01g38490D protein n=1 Tax=Brassica napus TaxID=3708 RepID=A0A078ILV0_BRANA|nr:BnaC01g38490D [Brassica napus]